MFKKLSLVLACLLLFSVTPVLAQVDYCEGNFDNDQDQDGTDAFVFKSDFGRSSLLDPCPVIECQTAEQLEMRIAQLETLLANVTRGTVQGQDTIRFSGVNVQIVNGTGDTSGTVNGRGNLIVGYNELRSLPYVDDRSGSHNIVVGSYQNYPSSGGLVAGSWNTISAPYASISGGSGNVSSGVYSSVSGGVGNTASGGWASVSGGIGNEASYYYASVSGGAGNTASGEWSSVSGGRYNTASGDYSFVGGGGGETEEDGNIAFARFSAVVGGGANIAGDPALTDHTVGEQSSVSGGHDNTASGQYASVGGGEHNTASATCASVTGGFINTASGGWSSISGGNSQSVTGFDDWRGGSCFFCEN